MALDLPFGIGPLQFLTAISPKTPTTLSDAFMSGGWLSGVCYPALVFPDGDHGIPAHLHARAWQRTYLAIFAAFLGTVGESFIIDTDHWRHFFIDAGHHVGMFAAAAALQGDNRELAAHGARRGFADRRGFVDRPDFSFALDHGLKLRRRFQHRPIGVVGIAHSSFQFASE